MPYGVLAMVCPIRKALGLVLYIIYTVYHLVARIYYMTDLRPLTIHVYAGFIIIEEVETLFHEHLIFTRKLCCRVL
jgi:hypothetical protein